MWSFACFGREKNTKETQTTMSYVRYLRHLLDPSGFSPETPPDFSDCRSWSFARKNQQPTEEGYETLEGHAGRFSQPEVVSEHSGRRGQGDLSVAQTIG